jgi:hypothetical protein
MGSGTTFSPWELSKAIASSIKDFTFDMLLMCAIVAEKENDGEGTKGDPSDGTGFEAVQDPMVSSTITAHTTSTHAPTIPSPSTSTLPTSTKHCLDSISNSDSSDDDDTSSCKCKKKKTSRRLCTRS